MNITTIEWTDYTWNPVTGCLGPKGDGVRCSYCYANRLAHGRLKALYLRDGLLLGGDYRDPFAPRYRPSRIWEPRKLQKPSKIFVCDMADLFGDWVPRWVQQHVINNAIARPQHTFQFLTKWPQNLARFNPWPPNAWVGATATDSDEAFHAAQHLANVDAPVRFMSLEPLLGHIDTGALLGLEWVIVGAETGPGARPPAARWIEQIVHFAVQRRLPIFLKNNLEPLTQFRQGDGHGGLEAMQNWPKEAPRG